MICEKFQLRLAHPHQSQLPEAQSGWWFQIRVIYNLDHVPKRGEKDKCLEANNNNNLGSFIISKVIAHLFRSPPGTPPFWIDWLLSD